MNKYDRVDALEKIRRVVLLELSPDYLSVKLESVIDDARALNQLVDERIVTVSDLAKLNNTYLPRITDRTITTVIDVLDEIKNSETSPAKVEDITVEQMVDTLKDNQKKAIVESYGLLHEKYSLQDIGKDIGVTRERARQIRNAGLLNLRKRFDPLHSEQIQQLIESARSVTILDKIEDISSIYKNIGVIELLIDVFPALDIKIHENKYLTRKVLLEKNNIKKFDKLIDEIIDTLQYQKGFVPLDDVAENFSVDRNIIANLKDSLVKDDHIALESNHNIFQRVFDVVVETLRNEGKPMTTRDIAKKSGLRWGQVRGVVMRKEKHVFANVGKSTYALTEWGYSELPTDELAYRYIKESEEPRLAKDIINHVGLHKQIEASSILASISLDKRIVPIKPGLHSLKEWGDTNYYTHRSFEVKCSDGIMEVLSESGRPMTVNEVLEVFSSKYGDKITDSYTTVNSTMKKLNMANKIEIIEHGKRHVRYKIASVKEGNLENDDRLG